MSYCHIIYFIDVCMIFVHVWIIGVVRVQHPTEAWIVIYL